MDGTVRASGVRALGRVSTAISCLSPRRREAASRRCPGHGPARTPLGSRTPLPPRAHARPRARRAGPRPRRAAPRRRRSPRADRTSGESHQAPVSSQRVTTSRINSRPRHELLGRGRRLRAPDMDRFVNSTHRSPLRSSGCTVPRPLVSTQWGSPGDGGRGPSPGPSDCRAASIGAFPSLTIELLFNVCNYNPALGQFVNPAGQGAQ